MLNNFYDSEPFFKNYFALRKYKYNANDKIERPYLLKLLPPLKGKKVLDLGCGMGNYSLGFFSQAKTVDAVDISSRMLQIFQEKVQKGKLSNINIIHSPIENFPFKKNYYDVVVSTLVFHYIKNLEAVIRSIYDSLKKKGCLVFSVEHPILTATKNIGWETNTCGDYLHWRLDNYFELGPRHFEWLEKKVIKYHRTLENYFQLLVNNRFHVLTLSEPHPQSVDWRKDKELEGHIRRPAFLMCVAKK